jgi:hypothetical protein
MHIIIATTTKREECGGYASPSEEPEIYKAFNVLCVLLTSAICFPFHSLLDLCRSIDAWLVVVEKLAEEDDDEEEKVCGEAFPARKAKETPIHQCTTTAS